MRLRAERIPRDDALLAGALAAFSLLQVLVFLPIASPLVGVLVALGMTLPVAFRRTHPLAAAVAGTPFWFVPTDGYILVGYIAIFFLFYSVGAHVADRRLVAATVLYGLVASLGGTALHDEGIGEFAGATLAILAPPAVGVLVRRQREQARRLSELAVHLERERDRGARIAVAEERARIARELHDIVSHSVSLIAVQSDAAAAALGHDPALARRPLETIRASASDALGEMRRLLGVLRADDEDGREPLPGLANLPALVERERAVGARVELVVEGEPRPLPQSADLSGYRLVQEALTNVRKHAPGATARVRLRWDERGLEISVVDDGPGPRRADPPADAHGLVGMRERVRLHGGTLVTGPAAGGGFEVRALLPVEDAP